MNPPRKDLALSVAERAQAAERFALFQQTTVGGLAFWWVLIGGLVFGALTWIGFHFASVKRMIENIPTSASLGVSFGMAEVKGDVVFLGDSQDQPTGLTGPVSHKSCVWYRYLIEERRGSGKHSRWVTLSDETKSTRFYCEDSEGRLEIDSEGAEIITRHKKTQKQNSMRYTEWSIRPGDQLYAIGPVNVDSVKGDTLILGQGEKDDLFILSNYSEKEIMIRKAANSMIGLGMAFSALFFAAIFYHAMNGQFSATDYLMSGIVGPIFLTFVMFVFHYNDLVFLRQRADRNWANIQISLKKRFNLLMQLQNVMSEYQQYEKTLLTKITEQRKNYKKYTLLSR